MSATDLGNLTWDAEFPEGGLIQMSIALANERDKLGDADWITIAVAPDDVGARSIFERLDVVGEESRRFLRVKIGIRKDRVDNRPSYRAFQFWVLPVVFVKFSIRSETFDWNNRRYRTTL